MVCPQPWPKHYRISIWAETGSLSFAHRTRNDSTYLDFSILLTVWFQLLIISLPFVESSFPELTFRIYIRYELQWAHKRYDVLQFLQWCYTLFAIASLSCLVIQSIIPFTSYFVLFVIFFTFFFLLFPIIATRDQLVMNWRAVPLNPWTHLPKWLPQVQITLCQKFVMRKSQSSW